MIFAFIFCLLANAILMTIAWNLGGWRAWLCTLGAFSLGLVVAIALLGDTDMLVVP